MPVFEVYVENDEFEVWLEPNKGDKFVGMCVGHGRTRAYALQQAAADVASIADALRYAAVEALIAASRRTVEE